ncbi:MAG: co-chaperone GroES [Candidatus Pacebacteria bacterium]|nr:co-chaperone GroES [Candidatus Paceibacterota bacterium]PIR59772.1 MAG: co-chaperone GroES [Candidatus Pacebacteria bacterium CG10_big_fil_rev_8_21_14_0_10_45_6]
MTQTISVSSIKPNPGYVLVEPAKVDKKTASGIYLPDSHEEKPQHGTVLAVGAPAMVDGVEVSCPVKVKDAVIYKKWGGNEFQIGDIEYQFLKFEDILAVVTK